MYIHVFKFSSDFPSRHIFNFAQCKTVYKKSLSFLIYGTCIKKKEHSILNIRYVQGWDLHAVLRQLTPCRIRYSNLVPINLVPSLCYMDYHTIDLSLYCSSSSVGAAPVGHQFQKSLLSDQTNHCHLLDE